MDMRCTCAIIKYFNSYNYIAVIILVINKINKFKVLDYFHPERI